MLSRKKNIYITQLCKEAGCGTYFIPTHAYISYIISRSLSIYYIIYYYYYNSVVVLPSISMQYMTYINMYSIILCTYLIPKYCKNWLATNNCRLFTINILFCKLSQFPKNYDNTNTAFFGYQIELRIFS